MCIQHPIYVHTPGSGVSTLQRSHEIKTYSHSSAEEVAKLAKKYRIKRLVLTHLSSRYKTEKPLLKAVKPIFKNAIVARGGMRIVI